MRILTRLNALIEKYMPLVTPTCLLLGVVFSAFFGQFQRLVPWLFAFLTFTGSLNSCFRDIRRVVLHPLSLLLILVMLHLVMPALACLVGNLFFEGHPDLIAGIVLEYSVPTAVVSLIWVSIYHGNSALSLSVVLIDTLLSPVLTPLMLKVFIGSQVKISVLAMMSDLVLMIALPAVVAMIVNQISRGRAKTSLAPLLAPFSKLCLMLVIMINSSKVAPCFANLTPTLIGVACTILVLAASGHCLGWLIARVLKRSREDTVSLTFGSGMRNISAGAVIAMQYFPAEVLFPVMIGTLFQQILAAVSGWLLLRPGANDHQHQE